MRYSDRASVILGDEEKVPPVTDSLKTWWSARRLNIGVYAVVSEGAVLRTQNYVWDSTET